MPIRKILDFSTRHSRPRSTTHSIPDRHRIGSPGMHERVAYRRNRSDNPMDASPLTGPLILSPSSHTDPVQHPTQDKVDPDRVRTNQERGGYLETGRSQSSQVRLFPGHAYPSLPSFFPIYVTPPFHLSPFPSPHLRCPSAHQGTFGRQLKDLGQRRRVHGIGLGDTSLWGLPPTALTMTPMSTRYPSHVDTSHVPSHP
jgi:hypothetical protein